jgi:transmembrane sensor
MKREDLIKEWMEGRLTADELDKQIQGDKALSDIKNIIATSATLDAPKKRTKEEAWNLLSSKIEERKSTKVIRLNPYKYIGIAASFTLIAIVIYTMFLKPERIITPKGQHISHVLPDGSEVWLNADSELSYRSFAQDGERKVHLKGEAFFNIKKGGHFEVVSAHGTVVVLGTSFNVHQRDNKIEVACFTGTVEVWNNDGLTITLNAGEITRSMNQTLTPPAKFSTEKAASWITGDFYFENVPLEEVLSELERQFNIQVQYKSTTPRSYTGYFNNKDLDEALQLIFQPMSLEYKKEGNKIIVD